MYTGSGPITHPMIMPGDAHPAINTQAEGSTSMSVIRKIVNGRASRVRCDGCGRLSSNQDGYYFDRKLGVSGYIRGQGWQCEHDFCDQCVETRLSEPEYACPFDGDTWMNYVERA
jgi:hypothetical protein